VNHPTDIPVFHRWEDAAVHALQSKKAVQNDLSMKADTQDKAAMATYAEFYNGLGYQMRGQPSPYVFSGTNQYKSGKYVADGKYDSKTVDRQMGVMGLIGGDKAPA
jgi:lysozyme family protein